VNGNQAQMRFADDEVMSQTAAYRLMNVSRAVLRGLLDRGELCAVDYHGARGSARVLRSEVQRFMQERGMALADRETLHAAEAKCSNCSRIEAELARRTDAHERTQRALAAAVAR
jgi:hypothetical protein